MSVTRDVRGVIIPGVVEPQVSNGRDDAVHGLKSLVWFGGVGDWSTGNDEERFVGEKVGEETILMP